ncbi:MAG: ABC transporter ATP-binding protein, partial [Zetaproteobacteria bacterium CG_4_8_14_3_um_filter_59_5]
MIRCKALTKMFGDAAALNGVDIHVRAHKTTVIMGGSGSGKTTLLRLIAGLEEPTSG